MAAVDPRDDPAAVVAAQSVLLELWTILPGFADAMTIVGGSVLPRRPGNSRTIRTSARSMSTW